MRTTPAPATLLNIVALWVFAGTEDGDVVLLTSVWDGDVVVVEPLGMEGSGVAGGPAVAFGMHVVFVPTVTKNVEELMTTSV